jgi:hypothetical protein
VATLENKYLRISLSWQDGLRMKQLVNEDIEDDALKETTEAKLFVITMEDEQIDATEFTGDAKLIYQGTQKVWSWKGRCARLNLEARLDVTMGESAETIWRLEVRNVGDKPVKLKIAFPVLDGLRIGDDLQSNRYFHGLNGSMMSELPIDLKAMYGYSLPVMDVYDERAGGGFYIRVNDTDNLHKVLDLVKRMTKAEMPPKFHDVAGDPRGYADVLENVGVGMAVHYLQRELPPGAVFRSPPTVIGAHKGDWRASMEAYRDWVKTWYRQRARRPLWFRRVFAHKALHQRHYHPGDTYRLLDSLQPGDDMVNLNHWMESRGEYRVRADWNGAEPLRGEIRRAREIGVRTALYLEAVCVDRQSPIGMARGRDWAVLQNGVRVTSEPTVEWNFCAGVVGWQDYLAETCARLLRETDCDAIYLDSVGLRYYLCEDTDHDHPPGSGWYGSVERLLQKVRHAMEEVKPDAVLYLEYLSTDVNTQYLDGSFSPCVSAGLALRERGLNLSPTGTNLFRFYFPDFKFIEIVPETAEGIGLAFFNGNGVHGYLDDPAIRPLVERLSHIFREHRDAFTSDHPIPFVPTLQADIYAHAFPGKGKTLYTIYNANEEAIEGEILEVASEGDARFEELVREREVKVRSKGEKMVLSFRIEPREVLCVAVLQHN